MTSADLPLWWRLVPDRARRQIEGRPALAQIVRNAGWLVADKFIRLGVAVFLNVWIARYLGPTSFGLLSYAQAVAVLLTFLSTLGLPDIIIRDLARMSERRRTILASAFLLRLAGAALVMALALICIVIARPGEPVTWAIVGLFASAQFAQAMDVIDSQYQTINRVRPVVVLRNASFLAFSLSKVLAIVLGGSVATFAILYTAELFVTAGLLWLRARRDGYGFIIADATISEVRRMLVDCAPLVLRLGAIGIYLRIDQVMIGWMLGDASVGLYVAGTRLIEPWYVMMTAAITAFVPRLAQIHHLHNDQYEAQLVKVIRAMFYASVAMALAMTVVAPFAVNALYGSRFAQAAPVLMIHAWAAVFSTFGQSVGAWFVNKRLVRYGVYQSVAAALVNVALCFALIPQLGITGAAVAAVASQFVAGVAANLVFPATRRVFTLQMRAILWHP